MYKTVKPCKNAAQPKSAIQKRKRVVLNFLQKEEIIQKLKDGHAAKKLAVDFEVGISTIYDISKSSKYSTTNSTLANIMIRPEQNSLHPKVLYKNTFLTF